MGMYCLLSAEMIKEGIPPLIRIFRWPTNVTKEQGRFQQRRPQQKDRNHVQAPTLGRSSLLYIKKSPYLSFSSKIGNSKPSTFGKTYLDATLFEFKTNLFTLSSSTLVIGFRKQVRELFQGRRHPSIWNNHQETQPARLDIQTVSSFIVCTNECNPPFQSIHREKLGLNRISQDQNVEFHSRNKS